MFRLTSLITALLLLAPVQVLAQTAAVKVSAAQTLPAAVPGGYVTLMYSAEGQGEYDFEVTGSADWQPVTRTRRLKLNGHTLLPVTFRVPALALVGQSPPLVLRALQGGQEVGRTQGFAQVQPHPRLHLSSPARVSATTAHPLVVPLEVTNLGNQTDTVTLSIANQDTSAHLSQQQLVLKPGESRTVSATLTLDRVSENFLYILFFEATSSLKPGVTASARTDALFNSVAVVGTGAVLGPTLTLGLGSSVDATAKWTPQGSSTELHYSVRPVVGGALSDYVDGQADLSGLEGTTSQPLPSGVGIGLEFSSQRWGANLSASSRGVGIGGSLNWRGWLLSSSARYQALTNGNLLGVSAGASTSLAGGQLALDATSTLISTPGERRRADSFGVSYARTFGGRWAANAGVRAGGAQAGGQYSTTLGVSQQLSYNAQVFDVTQSYFGSLGGLQVIGLSGGLRSTQPFGVRGALSLLIQPAGLTWTTSGLLLYSAPRGLGLSLSGRATGSSSPGQEGGWQATLSASAPPLTLGSAQVSVAAAYSLSASTQPSGSAAPGQLIHEASLDTALLLKSLQGKASLNWQRADENDQQLRLSVSGAYLWQANTFSASYSREIQTRNQLTSQQAEASWSRDWTPRLSTTLNYSRAWSNQAGSSQVAASAPALGLQPAAGVQVGTQPGTQSLGISIGVQDVGLPGLRLSAGYRLTSPIGALALSQALSVGLGYNLAYRVATPGTLVDLFGGRKGGKVHGVLFQDDNLDGVQDAGEAGLAGVQLQIGSVKTVTDARGAYQLQVPVGSYIPLFTAGLPATVEALNLKAVEVKENADIPTSLAFAPVAAANAVIFNDLDMDGVQGENEVALPYASVQLSGPVSRTVQADARGVARLSALPAGDYRLSLTPDGLPQGFEPSRPVWLLSIQPGQRVPDLHLGAARPARKIVTTYTAGTLTVRGGFPQDALVVPGSSVPLKLQLRGVEKVMVSAFGQQFTPKLTGTQLTQTIAVPPGTAPGVYDVTVVAYGDGGQKTFPFKLLVEAAQSRP